jgi:CRP/FNR family cyclic AMP-dependent transcriptional regulator
MAKPPVSLLQDVPLFSGFTPGEFSHVAEFLHLHTFPAGTNLLTGDQPGEVAYIILSGAVKVILEHPGGRNVILAILGPGAVVGEMSLIDQLTRSATAVTLEECSMLWLDRNGFWKCLEAIPVMNYNLARILSRRLRLTNAHIQSLAALDLYGRVARQIVVFAEEYGQPLPSSRGALRIPFRLTQTDVSDLVGASRGRVNQVLGSFKERKFILVDSHHHITVLNKDALVGLYE